MPNIPIGYKFSLGRRAVFYLALMVSVMMIPVEGMTEPSDNLGVQSQGVNQGILKVAKKWWRNLWKKTRDVEPGDTLSKGTIIDMLLLRGNRTQKLIAGKKVLYLGSWEGGNSPKVTLKKSGSAPLINGEIIKNRDNIKLSLSTALTQGYYSVKIVDIKSSKKPVNGKFEVVDSLPLDIESKIQGFEGTSWVIGLLRYGTEAWKLEAYQRVAGIKNDEAMKLKKTLEIGYPIYPLTLSEE
jgi:hypothetical protein